MLRTSISGLTITGQRDLKNPLLGTPFQKTSSIRRKFQFQSSLTSADPVGLCTACNKSNGRLCVRCKKAPAIARQHAKRPIGLPTSCCVQPSPTSRLRTEQPTNTSERSSSRSMRRSRSSSGFIASGTMTKMAGISIPRPSHS